MSRNNGKNAAVREMRAHQAPGVDAPVGLGARLAEGPDEQCAVFIAAEDVRATFMLLQ